MTGVQRAAEEETALKIHGETGPVFARRVQDEEHDYKAVYDGIGLTEYESEYAIRTLRDERGGERIPIEETPFGGEESDPVVREGGNNAE